MAGASLPSYLDGAAVPLIDPNPLAENFEHAQIEHWGSNGKDDEVGYPTNIGIENTTYKALRIMGDNAGIKYDLFYSVWCSNQHELYNMTTDPGQMKNLFEPYSYPGSSAGGSTWSINRLESRLDALLLGKYCTALSFPANTVANGKCSFEELPSKDMHTALACTPSNWEC